MKTAMKIVQASVCLMKIMSSAAVVVMNYSGALLVQFQVKE